MTVMMLVVAGGGVGVDVGVEDDCQSVARIYGIKSEPLNKYT